MDLNEGHKQLLKAKMKAAGVTTIRSLRLKSREKFFRTSVLAGTSYLDEATADVMIICQNGQVVKAHRIILCLASEFFTNVLDGQNPNKKSVITIPDIGSETMIVILTLIYKNEPLKLRDAAKNEVHEWLNVFGLSDRVFFGVEQSDDTREQAQEPVQLILPYPMSEGQMRKEPQIPIRTPAAKPAQQQQVAVAGPSRNVYVNQMTGNKNSRNIEMPDDVPSSATGEPPLLERMVEFGEQSTSNQAAKKHVRFASGSPEVSNNGIFHRGSQSEARETVYEPEQIRVNEPVKRKPGRPRKTPEPQEPTRFKASAAAGSARQARAQSQHDRSPSPYGGRRTRSRSKSRSRSRNRFDDTTDRVEESSVEDYSGEKRAKLLGTNPKCSRLKAMLKSMKQ